MYVKCTDHFIARAGERDFPPGFMAVAKAAAEAITRELQEALYKAATLSGLGPQFAVRVGGRRFTADLRDMKNGIKVATEVALGSHIAVIGMSSDKLPVLVTVKPNETRAKRALKASRNR